MTQKNLIKTRTELAKIALQIWESDDTEVITFDGQSKENFTFDKVSKRIGIEIKPGNLLCKRLDDIKKQTNNAMESRQVPPALDYYLELYRQIS